MDTPRPRVTYPMISSPGRGLQHRAFTTSNNAVMSFISNYYTEDKVVSSAMAWIYFLIVIAVVAVIASILSAFVFYQRKND